MKTLNKVALLVACVLVGALVSAVITMSIWNFYIAGKAFHCTDIGFGSYSTHMNSHRNAGDTISPGWTWEKLKAVRENYIAAFYLIWSVITGVAAFVIVRQYRRPPKISLETTVSGLFLGR